MASQIEIANRAISKIGGVSIVSLSDGSREAREVSVIWPTLVDSELARHPWSFAVARASLAASVNTPEFGYANAFPIPADCLRVVSVGDYPLQGVSDLRVGDDSEYVVEGNAILSDADGPLQIRYVSRVSETSRWSPLFVDVFICALAVELCEPIAQSTSKKQDIAMQYQAAVRQAKAENAIIQPPRDLPDNSWILARS